MYIEKDGVARVVPLVAKLTTMLSHRRDQIVEGRTSIFRVTPRQKHPAVVRTAPVQFLENTSIYLSLRATAVYYVYTGTTSHLSLFPPLSPSRLLSLGLQVPMYGHRSRAEARGRRSFTTGFRI